jgi:hypothetical protein
MPGGNASDEAAEPQGYFVYLRKSDEWALVHRADCRFPRHMNGARGVSVRGNTGTWAGPFATREEAFARAQAHGIASVRGCTYCRP